MSLVAVVRIQLFKTQLAISFSRNCYLADISYSWQYLSGKPWNTKEIWGYGRHEMSTHVTSVDLFGFDYFIVLKNFGDFSSGVGMQEKKTNGA